MNDVSLHYTSKLSPLDATIISHVPPGGNWKDIPTTVPSQRLAQIRESFKAGKGSRSTYYGRLRWDRPAYTISTYFNRPGNGCHIHPAEPRLISFREAARLQGFPDRYEFVGTQRSILMQVGNALPSLVALHFAKSLGVRAHIDLFCGAGGLSLGLEASGSSSLAAVDFNEDAVATYCKNREAGGEPPAIVGDLTDDDFVAAMLARVGTRKGSLDAVVGGPPCQGFSHAGNRRSTDDPRNQLVGRFIGVVERSRPRAFLMENVLGIRTIDGGQFLNRVLDRYKTLGYRVGAYVVSATSVGIPQRRDRVIVVGRNDGGELPVPPEEVPVEAAVTMRDALADLPVATCESLEERTRYASVPTSDFQCFIRGTMPPSDYLERFVRSMQKRLVLAV